MSESLRPTELRDLVARYVPSMLHLDLLLLLRGGETRSWTADAAAHALQIETRPCAETLDDIRMMQLALREDVGDGPTYRFHPANPDLAAIVTSLVTVYERQPVTLIRAIYESSSGAQRFADAFRLRNKEEPHG